MSTNKVTATRIDLLKGGGAIEGLGETFQADELTGTSKFRDSQPGLSLECHFEMRPAPNSP